MLFPWVAEAEATDLVLPGVGESDAVGAGPSGPLPPVGVGALGVEGAVVVDGTTVLGGAIVVGDAMVVDCTIVVDGPREAVVARGEVDTRGAVDASVGSAVPLIQRRKLCTTARKPR